MNYLSFAFFPLSHVCMFACMCLADQEFARHGGHLVVGTPGRLEQVISHAPFFNIKTLELLILDEADRLLDLGFEITINNILKKLPKLRRTVSPILLDSF